MWGYIVKITLLILLISGIIYLYYSNFKNRDSKIINSTTPIPTSKLQNILGRCIQERSYEFQTMQDAALGSLTVRFVNRASFEESLEQIKRYNLAILKEYRSTIGGVSLEVPKGTEVEWACRLSIDPYVKSVSFDRNT